MPTSAGRRRSKVEAPARLEDGSAHTRNSTSDHKALGDAQNGAGKPDKTDSFPVVAVGASAGGLEAFTQLLHTLPNNTGMAFVFIQHLDPTHHSMLSELLAKTSRMPVLEARDGTSVEPNHVYVIPPNVNMGILHRRLQLTPRAAEPGHHAPIDFFMRSLAEARNSRSIGVVLSGTASDGTRGLAAIKEQGGITFAQNEKSAKYNGMPHSAIAAGWVDFVMSPEKIGLELARISRHAYLRHESVDARAETVKKRKPAAANFDKIFALLRNTCGINFREYKPGTIQRRTLRRMALLKMDDVSDYTPYLEKHTSEIEALCQDLLIPVTTFFRDPKAFEALQRKAFPSILKDQSNKGNIRIWAPGCSTGEESYSLAILLLEFLGDKASSFQIQIFGTDVNGRGIEKARGGLYQERISQEVSPDRLRRFFNKVEEGYRVSKGVRDLCVFAKHNLAQDPPFSQMNLVVCRNLLIYLGPALQSKVMPILHYALRPSGFLMLGNAESVSAFPDLFAPADKKHKIFKKRAVGARVHYDFSAHRYPRETLPLADKQQTAVSIDSAQQQHADRIVLAKYAPPGVVINENMEILQFRGSLGAYVEPAPGRASLNLLKIARKDFVTELRAAVNLAKRTRALVKRQSVEFRHNGQLKSVNILVEPLEVPENGLFLVLFERTSLPDSPHGRTRGNSHGMGQKGRGETALLRRKLGAAEEHLRSVIESKEASDEEYQSANEEILSANEELQSTNEELETSKEELQSANEELNTVNEELHSRNLELDRASSDLNNLLLSTTLPVLLVDRGLRIRRMTAASAKILKILSSDIGRPVTDIRWDIDVPDLRELLAAVIDTLTPKELEVRDKQGRWYSLQIRPYRSTDDKIDGAVIILSDIDALKRLNQRLERSKEFTEHVIDTVREPLAVLDRNLKVLYVNTSFLNTFGVTREATEGQLLYRLGDEQWNIPKLRAVLEDVILQDSVLSDFEVEHDFPRLGPKTMILNSRKIEGAHRDEPLMLLAIEDFTDRKRIETARDRLADIVEASDDAIIGKDIHGVITSWNAGAEHLFGYPAREAVGRSITIIIPPDRLHEEPEILERMRRGEHIEHFETVRINKDGRRLDISLSISPIQDASGRTVGISKIARDVTDRKQAQRALEQSHAELESLVEQRTASVRELSLSLLRSQDDERRRISRELHDSLGQHLAGAKMAIEALRRPGATEKENRDFSYLADLLDKCLSETRTISHLLHPPLLDEIGFASAAHWYVEGFSQRSGIQVRLGLPDTLERLAAPLELVLFRILQESLTNIHRHSKSRSVDIDLQLNHGRVSLQVRDHGQGMPLEVLERFKVNGTGAGVGLRSMRERISELGGRFEIQSDKNGTLIRVTAPLAEASEKSRTAAGKPSSA